MTYPVGGSEYGGRPGLVQPAPHDIKSSAYEQAMLAVRTNPADANSSPETVLAQDLLDGAGRD